MTIRRRKTLKRTPKQPDYGHPIRGFRMPKKLYQHLGRIARTDKMSRSAVLAELIMREYNRRFTS